MISLFTVSRIHQSILIRKYLITAAIFATAFAMAPAFKDWLQAVAESSNCNSPAGRETLRKRYREYFSQHPDLKLQAETLATKDKAAIKEQLQLAFLLFTIKMSSSGMQTECCICAATGALASSLFVFLRTIQSRHQNT